jgi:uroporphyrinogen III methyltransferase/synthase
MVVTRPRHLAAALGDMLEEQGADVLYLPAIAIEDPPSWDELDRAIGNLSQGLYSWVVLTSVNAVDKFCARLDAANLDARAFGGARVAAVGSSTAQALAKHRIRADLVPTRFTAETLAESLGRGSGRVLVPRAAGAPRAALELLEAGGWILEEIVAYATVRGSPGSAEISRVRSGDFDVVTFTSGSSVAAFVDLVAAPGALGLDPRDAPVRLVACIGPKTAGACRRLGFRVDLVSEEHSASGLVRALVTRLASSTSTRA